MARTFRIYDKNKTIVYEGDNPLIISNLTENTAYPAQYTMTALEKGYESDPITIPEFRTYLKQSITVAGVETTGEYKTLDVTQADYLALATKDNNTLYRVQPTDSGSGRVHFLGSQIVDLTKDKDGNVVYSRNLVMQSSNFDKLGFNKWNISPLYSPIIVAGALQLTIPSSTAQHFKTPTTQEMVVNVGESWNVNQLLEIKTSNPIPLTTFGLFLRTTAIAYPSGSEVTSNDFTTLNLKYNKVAAQNTLSIDSWGGTSSSMTNYIGETVSIKRIKYTFNNINVIEYTLAPEDITSSANSGGGTFG